MGGLSTVASPPAAYCVGGIVITLRRDQRADGKMENGGLWDVASLTPTHCVTAERHVSPVAMSAPTAGTFVERAGVWMQWSRAEEWSALGEVVNTTANTAKARPSHHHTHAYAPNG